MKELIEEKKFEMRAYDKVELALLYCPGRSAESALKHWWDGSSNASRWCRRWAASDIMCGGIVSCVRRWNRLSVIWASLEKERMKFFISAAVHTSTSGFQYIIQQIVVLLFLSSCICLSSFQYLMEAVSVLLFPDSSTCTSRFLYNLCFFLVLVSGTFLNSVVTSMYVFYTNLSGVFRYCHCQLPLSAYLSVNSFILIYLSVCFSMYFSSMRLFRYLQVLRSLIPSVSAFSLICL